MEDPQNSLAAEIESLGDWVESNIENQVARYIPPSESSLSSQDQCEDHQQNSL